ncbi:hypothetical protein COL77_25950 [Bacillus wiedmannii]|uniref:hypothetical protein n=1 Tax=Bacillus wiedmannii TaxID=1890302 RepID=UPI000BF8CEFF|nr:hypothetical protein [Bacillus wiedmannii]PFZ37999.1 hypothetical protein COL77_25950 [Bacillus wiedmannii]
MAKLNVKVINETVEYNGFVYESVTDGAKTNDLIQCFENDSVDLTYGAFYQVIGTDDDNDMQFLDDDNDERDRSVTDEEYKVFRKSHEITTDKLTDAEGVVKIELPDGTKLEGTPSDLASVTRSMQALQAEQVATVEVPEEVDEEDEVLPPQLKAGEYGKVVEKYDMFLPGDIVKVLRNDGSRVPYYAKRLSGGEEKWLLEKQLVRATEAEVKAATEPQEEPLKVGDYAKLISTNFNTNAELYEIVVINVEDKTVIPYGIKNLKGEKIGWAPKDHLVKATDEEVLEANQSLLKKGDYARIIGNTSSHKFEIGTIVKLERYASGDDAFAAYYLDESDFWYAYRRDFEPLTKEEAEHIAREAEEEKKVNAERAKWEAIGREVGELRNGDVVQFTESTGTSDFPEGSVAIITNVIGNNFNFGEDGLYDGKSSWIKLIVPVEERFDTVG